MRRAIGLAALALALAVAAPAAGRGRPHAAIAGESIAVTDVAFGATGSVTYTSADPAPWVRIFCLGNATTDGQASGVVLDTYLDVFRGNVTFLAGPTPSWAAGAADCTALLLHLEDGTFSTLASSAFRVT